MKHFELEAHCCRLLESDEAVVDGAEELRRDLSARFVLATRGNRGMRLVEGNLGRAIVKVSAVAPERHIVEAPARVFQDQDSVKAAFRAGEFTSDTVIVVRFQGPKANGMPELHGLTPTLAVLQDRGLKVALVTDGRMSGASGKVPSAIHVCPEAADGGPLARVRDGDVIRVDAVAGTIACLAEDFDSRTPVTADLLFPCRDACLVAGQAQVEPIVQMAGARQRGGLPRHFPYQTKRLVAGQVQHQAAFFGRGRQDLQRQLDLSRLHAEFANHGVSHFPAQLLVGALARKTELDVDLERTFRPVVGAHARDLPEGPANERYFDGI